MSANSRIRWYFCTKAIYDKLVEDNQVYQEGFYFLSDTNEYYYKGVNYMRNTVFVTSTLPSTGISSTRIYFNTGNLTAYTYNTTSKLWDVLVEPAKVAVIQNDAGVPQMVTGAAVKTYVDELIDTAVNGTVINISWSGNNTLVFNRKVNENGPVNLTINEFGASISRDINTGDIVLKAADGITTLATINIPVDRYTVSGVYNDTEKAIILTMSRGDVVKIYAESIINLYNAITTNSITTQIVNIEGKNYLQMDVKISGVTGNELELITDTTGGKTTGLFIHRNHLMDFVANAEVKNFGWFNIDKLDATGNSADTGKGIGGDTLSNVVANRANLLTRESALSATKKDIEDDLSDTYVPLSSVSRQYSTFANSLRMQSVS